MTEFSFSPTIGFTRYYYIFSGELGPGGGIPPEIRNVMQYDEGPVTGTFSYYPFAEERDYDLEINGQWNFRDFDELKFKYIFQANRDAANVSEPSRATMLIDDVLVLYGVDVDTGRIYSSGASVEVTELIRDGQGNEISIPPSLASPQLDPASKEVIKKDSDNDALIGLIAGVASLIVPGISGRLLGIVGVAFGVSSYWKSQLLNDPPDPEYQNFVLPIDKDFVPSGSNPNGLTQQQINLVHGLTNNSLEQASLYEAILKTFDKSAGAELAGDEFWRHQQLLVADDYFLQAVSLLEENRQLSSQLEAVITSLELDEFIEVEFDEVFRHILFQDYSQFELSDAEFSQVFALLGDAIDGLSGQRLDLSETFIQQEESIQELIETFQEGTLKPATIYVDRADVIVGGPQDNETYSGSLIGTNQNDFVVGSFGRDRISSGAGDDQVYSGVGDDALEAGIGNDLLDGGGGNDIINGLDFNTVTPGLGEIDILTGGSGGDLFILGNGIQFGYDDGNISSNGAEDYALITDFNPAEDIIQLHGAASDYRLETAGSLTQLYRQKPGSEPDELIAQIQGTASLDLTSTAFDYVNGVAIAATAFDLTNAHVLLGEAQINYTLENQGSNALDAVNLQVIYSDDDTFGNNDDQIVDDITLPDLLVGETVSDGLTVQLPVDLLNSRAQAEDDPGQGSSYVSQNVDFLGLVTSTGELLASRGITYFPWDIDGSGQVTPSDAIFVINRLGQTTTPENALADFDGSGQITPSDAIAAINRLGYSINPQVIETLV